MDNSATACGVNDRHVTDNGDEYKRVDGDGRFTESVPRPTRRGIGRILSGIQRAVQTVLGVYLKHTCSRVTSASSTLGVLNDYAL